MDRHEQLRRTLGDELDDVLATIALVDGDHELEDRLFGRLVDLLVESMFLELRSRRGRGEVSEDDYATELGLMGRRCRRAGLLPLPDPGR